MWEEGDDDDSAMMLDPPFSTHRTVDTDKLFRRRRTSCRYVAVTVLVLLVVVLAAALAFVVVKHKGSDDGGSKSSGSSAKTACVTAECTVAAAYMLQSMDQAADPCNDFFQFTCGGWINSHPIPEDKSSMSVFGTLSDNNYAILRKVLAQQAQAGSLDAQAQQYYAACNNLDSINQHSLDDFNNLVAAVINKAQSMEARLAALHEIGVSGLFSAPIGQDDKNPTQNTIFMEQSGLGLGSKDDYMFKNNTRKPLTDHKLKAYQTYLQHLFTLVGGADPAGSASSVIELEFQLAEIYIPRDKLQDANAIYNPMTVDELQALCPAVKWGDYFTAMFASMDNAPTIKNVVVITPAYFDKLSAILQNTTDKVLKAYHYAHALDSFSGSMGKDFLDAVQEVEEALYGTSQLPPRWLSCIASTSGTLGFVLGRMFVTEAFAGNSRDVALDMVGKIKASFEGNLPNVDWISKPTAAKAKEKAEAVIQKIGYPDWIMDDTKLTAYYDGLTISDFHLQNKVSSRKSSFKRMLQDYTKPVDRSRWDMTPQTVNAYYNPGINEIVFPAGILQPPFFAKGRPDSLNFGGIGSVIGHELTHGFDNTGRQYDKNGVLHMWWDQKDIDNFRDAARCIVNQYAKFKVGSENVNGNLTLGENIADNGGITEAFRAYKAAVKDKPQPLLPGLGQFSHDQLFFIAYGQVWCNNMRPEEASRRLYEDVHSPAKYRVNGVMSNTPEFSHAFGCSATAKLNPQHKCKVW